MKVNLVGTATSSLTTLLLIFSLEKILTEGGNVLRVTTIAEAPYLFKKIPNPQSNSDFEGFIPDILELVAKQINREYKLQLVSDGQYGSNEGGHWTGMIKEVMTSEADLAAAPLTVSKHRESAIDFTEAFMNFDTAIVLKKVPYPSSIKSMKDLADQTEIKYGLLGGGLTKTFFEESQEHPYNHMWQQIKKDPANNILQKPDSGVEKVRQSNGKYAFILEGPTAEFWINKQPCDLMMVNGKVSEKRYAWAVAKGNPGLKEKIDNALKHLNDTKELARLQKKWWVEKADCNGAESFRSHSMWYSILFQVFLITLAVHSSW